MAVTANQIVKRQGTVDCSSGPVAASTHLYQGTIAFWERTSGAGEGYLTDDDDGGANDFAGIVAAEADNSSGAAGAINAELYITGAFELQGTGFSQAIVGDLTYASDNFTITASASSTTKIGAFVEYVSATKMMVKIDVVQT